MKGRKANIGRQNLINNLFLASKNRAEFVSGAEGYGLSTATATVYWYNLSKATGRVVVEKRGRKPSVKTDATVKLVNVREYAEKALAEAKAAKKSTVALVNIVNMLK